MEYIINQKLNAHPDMAQRSRSVAGALDQYSSGTAGGIHLATTER